MMNPDPGEEYIKQLSAQIAQATYDAARVTTLRELRHVCEQGLHEDPLSAETMSKLIMGMISAVAVLAPINAQEEGIATIAAMTKLFEYAATQSTWNPAAGAFTKTQIPEQIRKQLDDLL